MRRGSVVVAAVLVAMLCVAGRSGADVFQPHPPAGAFPGQPMPLKGGILIGNTPLKAGPRGLVLTRLIRGTRYPNEPGLLTFKNPGTEQSCGPFTFESLHHEIEKGGWFLAPECELHVADENATNGQYLWNGYEP